MQKICAVVEQCKAPMGNAYREDCAAREMALILAEEITEPVIEAIKCSPAFSIIIDESTDTGDKSNMALRIKYFQNDVGECKRPTSPCVYGFCTMFALQWRR